MDQKEEQKKVIELLAQNEEAVSQLYKLFAKRFPSHNQFWAVLSLEELEHASWLRKLYSCLERGDLSFNKERFAIDTIKRSLSYIDKQLVRFEDEQLSIKDALSVAMDIEITLIESKFFQVYEADHEELKQVLRALEEAFLEHRNRLEEMMEKVTKSTYQ
ncbi:MAG: hypothetical protein JSW40_08100 [Candidatus Omnitrophota bacterium]|nr:MAG: hypothetical protein JSW40_08100 [Candidatus Omnitrophota bacterium]